MEWTGYWGNFKSESNTFRWNFVWKQLCTSKGNGGPTTCTAHIHTYTHMKVQTGNPHRRVNDWYSRIGLVRCDAVQCLSNFQFAENSFLNLFSCQRFEIALYSIPFNWHDVVWLAKSKSFLRYTKHTSWNQSFLCHPYIGIETFTINVIRFEHVWSKNLNWMWILQANEQASKQVKWLNFIKRLKLDQVFGLLVKSFQENGAPFTRAMENFKMMSSSCNI